MAFDRAGIRVRIAAVKRLLLTAALLLPLTATAGADVEQLAATCNACHGERGARPIAPNYPIIAGQYADYLAHALREYRSGARRNPVMNAQAQNLSDEDIEALSRHFAAQPSPLHTPALEATRR